METKYYWNYNCMHILTENTATTVTNAMEWDSPNHTNRILYVGRNIVQVHLLLLFIRAWSQGPGCTAAIRLFVHPVYENLSLQLEVFDTLCIGARMCEMPAM
jgi:hypothetical protein